MIKAVLLDLDGTLLDSNDAHATSWVETLREFGIIVDFQQVRDLIGMGSDHLLPKVTDISAESVRGKNIIERRGEIFRNRYLKHLKPFPQARELVQKLLSANLKIIVATSAGEDELKGILKQIGIEDLIEQATSADDAEESKPSPDIIIEALKKIKTQPDEAVMLGDTPYDIAAATKAGVKTIALLCGGWDLTSLKDAVAIYEDPADLLGNFDSSILYTKPKKGFWKALTN